MLTLHRLLVVLHVKGPCSAAERHANLLVLLAYPLRCLTDLTWKDKFVEPCMSPTHVNGFLNANTFAVSLVTLVTRAVILNARKNVVSNVSIIGVHYRAQTPSHLSLNHVH